MIRLHRPLPLALTVALVAVLAVAGCRKLDAPSAATSRARRTAAAQNYLTFFVPGEIGSPLSQPTWIAHVTAADLDRDGLQDAVACEAKENMVLWLRQKSAGVFEERVLDDTGKGPVHVEAVDIDKDGDLDLLVSEMGFVFPNNDKIGTVVILENDGRQHFIRHEVLTNTSRVTDIRAADFDEDGQLDLAVGQFGYDQGEVRWMRRTGPWTFDPGEVLVDLSGDINVCVADLNGDGHQDIVALISQQWEEIYAFLNDGKGHFTRKLLWGSTNEDYGSSGLNVADLNGDGRTDIVYTNGDGFGPAVTPGPRPWHGVQWFENTGGGTFKYHRIGDLAGAYSPITVDLDQDGATDIVVTTAYNEWNQKALPPSLVWYHNDGQGRFSPRILAHTPKDLISVTAGLFDGTGRPALITGGFPVNPPYERISRITLWRHSAP